MIAFEPTTSTNYPRRRTGTPNSRSKTATKNCPPGLSALRDRQFRLQTQPYDRSLTAQPPNVVVQVYAPARKQFVFSTGVSTGPKTDESISANQDPGISVRGAVIDRTPFATDYLAYEPSLIWATERGGHRKDRVRLRSRRLWSWAGSA